ncbi:MAG: hypothetical protein MJY68_00335 [Bacteroidaceae bacterium]|jgi:hypothetical protein|nr:hypothetical protein [Bacteroidaceae bacterium]MCQ2067541.1 hypothetical protein [Bacteroidaceae bacterium]
MNEPDQDRLALMERYGHALMKPADIAILLDIPADEKDVFCQSLSDFDTPEARAYRKGVANAKLELHENVVKLAVKGSPAAQPIANLYLSDL